MSELNRFEKLAFSGLGDADADFFVHLANRPPMDEFSNHDGLLPLLPGDIYRIGQETGNHWRKIFNVYAKLVFELGGDRTKKNVTWQKYRDDTMLQAGSGVALVFGGLNHENHVSAENKSILRLVMGKQFAEDSSFWTYDGKWLDDSFAINSKGWILCPYFDYRQLSNARISTLVSILKTQST